jgi:1-phosphatidylinositol phosphodiesterase
VRLAFLLLAACSGPAEETDWMASLDGTKLLTELSIPGSHDSGAMFEPYPGIAMAQKLTIADQLTAGIRYFDLRCRDVDDQFLIYHGAIDQNQTFDAVLATMSEFLAAHPKETVIASVKEEAAESGETIPFDQAFQQTYLPMAPWSTGATVPTLDDARGKLVLLRRFDTTQTAPLGIDASPWADNASFTISNTAKLAIEDNYIVTDNDSKWTDITTLLASVGDPSILDLAYTSGYQMISGLPDITIVSDDIDARLDTYLAANPDAPTGVLVMDFVTEARASAIIATNH